MDAHDDPEPFTLDDFRRGLELLAAESPEDWWGGFHDIDHPVGNLNASLCDAISALPDALDAPSILMLEVRGFGELRLQTPEIELRELFRAFSAIYAAKGETAELEWANLAITGEAELGPSIRMLGRAEKRLVVSAARTLLHIDAKPPIPGEPERLERPGVAFAANPVAISAMRQFVEAIEERESAGVRQRRSATKSKYAVAIGVGMAMGAAVVLATRKRR
mmetsp:Transcript_3757/g.7976  ORF Transcript_3757/g.7976 Transcript_3757/m.7976 type:complete len:221 (-) Transcript_3757:200-862(-)